MKPATPPGRLTGVYKDVRRGVFRAQVVGGQPTPTEESAAVEWRSADRIVSEMAATFSVRVLDADNVPAVVVDADEASLRGSN